MIDSRSDEGSRTDDDSAVNCRLLEESGLLDIPRYCAAAGLLEDGEAARHYLREGWRQNLDPGPQFDGGFLYPYYRTIGLVGPPALSFVWLRAAGWPVYPTRAHAQHQAGLVASSGLFVADEYAAQAGLGDGLDPALHYVLVGEPLGLRPSSAFDPEYYGLRYPDVARAPINRLVHYVTEGRREGRRPHSVAERLAIERGGVDPSRQTILLFSHEASRTGAPILSFNIALGLGRAYNVVAVLLEGGELFDDFRKHCVATVGPIPRSEWNDAEARRLVARLCSAFNVRYAIANSIETRFVLPALAHAHVPVVTLVHEFASYTRPAGSMGQALDWSTHVVFSAQIVADAAEREHPTLPGRQVHVLPQGPCCVPAPAVVREPPRSSVALGELAEVKRRDGALIVLGCGTVHLRKGVDLFLSCAAALSGHETSRPVRFLWIGDGYRPKDDAHYSCYLAEQLDRAGLTDSVAIVDAIPDLEAAYALADIFLLSSRLDPLPNVAIDAARRGLPVLCFDEATGMADVLSSDPITARGVVPHLDVARAAAVIARLAADEGERVEIGDATRRLAQRTFNTERYLHQLDELGIRAAEILQQRRDDFITLRTDPLFDMGVHLHPLQPMTTRDEAVVGFLARAHAVGLARRPASNGLFRRPCPGFHPQIYAHANRHRYDVTMINALAHFIRSGRPPGPWSHDVIVPYSARSSAADRQRCRVALHAHFFYPELAADLIRKLRVNERRCDLWLTTDQESKADALRGAAGDYGNGRVFTRVVPNRGRDIGPLLSGLAQEILPAYDVIGHVHGKRSAAADDGLGDTWREFLWQHLVGGTYPMLDIILQQFDASSSLGLVFAEDPYLSDWDDNLEIAAPIAARMGIDALPPFFEFPNGTMFWARSEALEPLRNLGFGWDDYPDEPVAKDGTVLHALERLIPFAAQAAGCTFATTHVAGVTR